MQVRSVGARTTIINDTSTEAWNQHAIMDPAKYLLWNCNNYFAPKYCDEYVCLSVCLSVRSHNSKTTRLLSSRIFCARYVWPWLGSPLPVLRYVMLSTSGFPDAIMVFKAWGKWARIKHDVIFRLSSPGSGTKCTSDNLVFGWVHQNAASGGRVSYLQLPCYNLSTEHHYNYEVQNSTRPESVCSIEYRAWYTLPMDRTRPRHECIRRDGAVRVWKSRVLNSQSCPW